MAFHIPYLFFWKEKKSLPTQCTRECRLDNHHEQANLWLHLQRILNNEMLKCILQEQTQIYQVLECVSKHPHDMSVNSSLTLVPHTYDSWLLFVFFTHFYADIVPHHKSDKSLPSMYQENFKLLHSWKNIGTNIVWGKDLC